MIISKSLQLAQHGKRETQKHKNVVVNKTIDSYSLVSKNENHRQAGLLTRKNENHGQETLFFFLSSLKYQYPGDIFAHAV